MKKFLIFAVVFVVLIGAVFWRRPVVDIGEGDFRVTLSIYNVLPPTSVAANDGDSVFDVLLRETRRGGIHMEFRNTPGLQSAYVMGIDNLYEFDEGPLSGWMFRVNGEIPNVGASLHILQPDDVVEWLFTRDLGRDL